MIFQVNTTDKEITSADLVPVGTNNTLGKMLNPWDKIYVNKVIATTYPIPTMQDVYRNSPGTTIGMTIDSPFIFANGIVYYNNT